MASQDCGSDAYALASAIEGVTDELRRLRKAVCYSGLVIALTNPEWVSTGHTEQTLGQLELLAKS